MFHVIDCQIETLGNFSNQTDLICKHNSVGHIDIPNGVGCYDGTISGSVVSYQCDKGYTLVGNTNQVCFSNGAVGNWSGEMPMCQSLGKFYDTHTHTHTLTYTHTAHH